MKDVKQRIVASLNSRPYGCDNYLLWAPPGSGKSFFVQEIAKSLGNSIYYREINLAQMDETQFRGALAEIDSLDKPRLCLIDEADSKPHESWPYEILLPSLEPPSGRRTFRTCFVVAGSSGSSTSGMKEEIVKRLKGVDLLSRIPPGNEFEIEGLGTGDRLLVVSTQFLNAATEDGREIHEVEKLVLYYVALNPRLKSARSIRQLAIRCMERVPPGEDRIRYDHLFDPGDPENKEFWVRASLVRNELVNVFVTLSESDRPSISVAQAISPKIKSEVSLETVESDVLPEKRNRLAVLPFANISPDPNDDYFAGGMTEELIDRLCQVKELEVIARTSVMKYKNKDKSAYEIGRELKIGSIVEGSVRKAGNKVRVTAQLVDANTEAHLWSSKYDRDLDDIFAVQTDIAEKVATALAIKLVPAERKAIEKRETTNTEANTLYLKGRYYFNERTREGFLKAIEYYETAINLDPKYVRALSGLAESYCLLENWGYMSPSEASPKAKFYAIKALEYDNTSAEAHASMALVLVGLDWDVKAAQREFKRAIELNPNYATAYHFYAFDLLNVLGLHEEAVAQLQIAKRLDPLSPIVGTNLGDSLLLCRRYAEAEKEYRLILEMEPNFAYTHSRLGVALVKQGRYEEGISEIHKAANLGFRNSTADLIYAYSVTGRNNEAKSLLEDFLARLKAGAVNVTNMELAFTYAAIDDSEKAFEYLKKAADEKSFQLLTGLPDITFDNMRSDPRFQDLLNRIRTGKQAR